MPAMCIGGDDEVVWWEAASRRLEHGVSAVVSCRISEYAVWLRTFSYERFGRPRERTVADPTGFHVSVPPAGPCDCSGRLRSHCEWAPELAPEAEV